MYYNTAVQTWNSVEVSGIKRISELKGNQEGELTRFVGLKAAVQHTFQCETEWTG